MQEGVGGGKEPCEPRPHWSSVIGRIVTKAMTSMTSEGNRQNDGVLVLGASGRLGGMLRRHWPEPEALRCQSRGASEGFIQFDLPPLGPPISDAALAAARNVRAIICLAGVTPANAASKNMPLSDNIDLALSAMELALASGVSRVLIASSAAVYGAGSGALSEAEAAVPLSAYGKAKLAMEQAVLARAQRGVTLLRIGNVAGADAILGGWRSGMQIDQFPDGRTPRRSYIGPVTLARVLHKLCDSVDLPPVLNVAAPGVVEMGALLNAAGLAWQPRLAAADSIAQVQLDTNALERHVDFAPENGSPAGLVGEWQQDQNQR